MKEEAKEQIWLNKIQFGTKALNFLLVNKTGMKPLIKWTYISKTSS
jgi:hypothetical protein